MGRWAILNGVLVLIVLLLGWQIAWTWRRALPPVEVVERRILPDELTQFSECFITGSAAEVTAVSEIAHWRFSPGAITRELMGDYSAEVQPKGKAVAA